MMKRLSLSAFGDRLVVLLPILMRELWEYERNLFSRGEVTIPQLMALTHLYESRSCTMRELTRALRVHESTATGLVDRMLKLNLVRRVRGDTDRRVVTVIITAQGSRVIERLQQQRRKGLMEIFKKVNAGDRSLWLEIIEKLVSQLSPGQPTKGGKR